MKRTITITVPDPDEVQFHLIPHPEDSHPRVHFASGDDQLDQDTVAYILRDLESNDWAWCLVEVRAEWGGLSASDYLGGCSYQSAEDFMKGGYWTDMKDRAYQELIGRLVAMEKLCA